MENPIVIVGAGLSGLRAASLLTAQGIKCRVLEARDRIGGRILSTFDRNRPDLGKFDLGPTWFWPQYERTISNLVKELGIPAKTRRELGEDKISNLVIEQLVRLFGPLAQNASAILYKDWSVDSETAVEEDSEPLRNYPRYGQLPIGGVWEKKIIFAGTETNSPFGGHLEGALQSAEQAVFEIIHLNNRIL